MTRAKTILETVLAHLERLTSGWSAAQPNAAQAVAQALGQRFQETAEVRAEAYDNGVRFRLDLSGIYLSGLGEEVRCLLVGGSSTATTEVLHRFWCDEGAGMTGLPLVFSASESAYEEAGRILPRWCGVRVSPGRLQDLLRDDNPHVLLKQLIRQQLNRRRLSFYNICLPATGNAFFGRDRELALLLENQATNYAIAGPSRIGKTSLLKRHRWNLVRQRDPRASRVFEIDFYPLGDTKPDTVARHIAMAIQPSSRSSRVLACELVAFLHYWRNQLKGPLELLLDETDEVCGGETFQQLGRAAKEGHVRLVMAGRKGLYDFAVRNDSTLGGRSKLLRLEPLEPADARELIRHPLGDLGIALREPARVFDYILHQTGRLPHLLQFYCEQLVELTAERNLDEVSYDLVRAMEVNGEFSQYFLGPLYEIRSPATRALAHAMLISSQPRFTTGEAVELAKALGQDTSPERVRQACDELVIQNILCWENDGLAFTYTLACHALKHFAQQAGLLGASPSLAAGRETGQRSRLREPRA